MAADPPSHTPAAGSQDYLWIAAACVNETGTPITGTPSGYSNLDATPVGSLTQILSGLRAATAASENPGRWLFGSAFGKRWSAMTISIPPTAVTKAAGGMMMGRM